MSSSALKNTEGLPERFRCLSLKLLIIFILIAAFLPGCGSGGGSDGGSGGGGTPGTPLTLGSVVQYSTQNVQISKIAIGDLNGDGLNDVAAIGDISGAQHIVIYYQGGDGRFIFIVTLSSPGHIAQGPCHRRRQ